jgi:hypothetical protein
VSFNFLFRIYSTDRPRSIKQFKQFLLVVPHLLSIHQIFSLRRKGKEGSLEQVHPTSSGMRNLYNQCTVFTQIHSAKLNLKKITWHLLLRNVIFRQNLIFVFSNCLLFLQPWSYKVLGFIRLLVRARPTYTGWKEIKVAKSGTSKNLF